MKAKIRDKVTFFLTFLFTIVKKLDFTKRYMREIVIDAYWASRLQFKGKQVRFFKGVIIQSPENVSVDDNSRIGDYVHMWGGGGITIGKNVLIATHSVITSQAHDINASLYIDSQVMKPVNIEDNVWIGASAVVLPGVTVGKNSIIGAGAIVTKNILPNSIAQGVPAKVVKKLLK